MVTVMTAKRNTEFKLSVGAPLLRPGLTIEAGPVSEAYVVETVEKLMGFVREINSDKKITSRAEMLEAIDRSKDSTKGPGMP
jgi:hypothetical protein